MPSIAMSLPRISVSHPIATIMFFLAVVLLGIISLQRLAVELFPEMHYPRLLIRTAYGDTAPEEVVEFVTRPIEEAVSAVGDLKQVTSRSRSGVSIVTLEFYWGTNMDYASLRVREKLDEIRVLLPRTAERPQLLRLDPSAQPIMQVAVSGVELSQLTMMCRRVVRRRLEQIRGIAFVEVVGGLEPQIEVQVHPEKLLTHNVTIEDISRALRANNVSFTGGTIKGGRYRYTLRIDGELRSLDDIRQVSIARRAKQSPLLLGDISNVFRAPRERRSITRLNGLESVGLLLTKEAGANTVTASRSVLEVLDQLRSEYPELKFFIVSRQSDFIEQSLSNVRSAILWGGLLAFLSLLFFLRTVTYPITISVSMPISIIATFVFMYFAGISVNMMSLGGLALGVGILVDNSIVVLENIFRLRESGHGLVSASVKGAEEVAMPVLASTLTTCAVFLPVAYISGVAGQLFRDLSLTVSFSLFCSLLVSLSMLPVLFSRFRGRPVPQAVVSPAGGIDGQSPKGQRAVPRSRQVRSPGTGRDATAGAEDSAAGAGRLLQPVFARFETGMESVLRAYHRLLRGCLENKAIALLILLVVFVLSLFTVRILDRRLFPPLRTDEVSYRVELSPDVTLYQTAEVVGAIESNLLNDASVEYVFSRIGMLESILQSGEEEAPYRAELTIRMKEAANMTPQGFMEHLDLKMPEQYEYQGRFESGERIYRQILGLFPGDLQVNVRGPTWEDLVPVAMEVENGLKRLPGIQATNISHRGGATQIRISVDRAKAAMYGISTDQVADLIRQNVKGQVATQIREFDRFVDIVVRPDIEWRDSWEDITSRILAIDGTVLTVEQLIHQDRVTAPEELLRDDQEHIVRVNAALSGISLKDAIRRTERMLAGIEKAEHVRLEIGGQHLEYQHTVYSIKFAFLLSLILVYIILAAQFESLRYPFVILLTVPLGTIGGIWLLAATGHSLNVISGIGFVVLAGIVVNDAIIKIDFINKARLRGKTIREAIYEAGEKRFRPIVITTVTTVFGLLPMALSGGTGGELRQPLAVVLIGGLSIATLFTLVVIPVIYELISGTERGGKH